MVQLSQLLIKELNLEQLDCLAPFLVPHSLSAHRAHAAGSSASPSHRPNLKTLLSEEYVPLCRWRCCMNFVSLQRSRVELAVTHISTSDNWREIKRKERKFHLGENTLVPWKCCRMPSHLPALFHPKHPPGEPARHTEHAYAVSILTPHSQIWVNKVHQIHEENQYI